ncbi:MAG: MarR family transcriptional regulator [Gemmatimonadetes bacterium]|uniref:MarR family transcriptional regulator n=1 Tax=Candidatus Kutchimonas denitrificans TaxID=3056748 RepID=A0AAE4Z569_9BACT|nr:MarR family transcriptional regulator [Gemmatimonadota bacterium]NIR73985.1 MarR family transcriptional regulator [Candidatus Kutchimonas denitrificans]NIS02974.1 MarR family transcriptional regulator [Gemmatimonadota bacterium]NIT68691.1 MarR family transcriptional regulator [Gemmatimonadota bacterium]NIU53272.1 MarR family transcriptional regulator [Gemmatimonadota bacterium]
MARPDLDRVLSHYVEQCGLLFDRWGFPRTAGRIWAWLHVCDPPEQTAGQLVDALHVSKGSVSTNTRLLEGMGLVERVGIPDSRQSHYRIRPGGLESMMRQRIVGTAEIRQLAEGALAALEAAEPERGQRLRAKRDFYAFWERELGKVLVRWQEERGAAPADD